MNSRQSLFTLLSLSIPISTRSIWPTSPPVAYPLLLDTMPQAAEAAKQQYARELAAYTLLQWNLAREKQAAKDSAVARTQAPAQSQVQENPSSTLSSSHHTVQSGTADSVLKAIDFAQSESRPPGNLS